MARRTGAGRVGGIEEARQLVALVGALNDRGDVLSVDAIVSRLGVTRDTAMKLLMLIMSAGDDEDTRLAVMSSDSFDEIRLVFSGGMRGKGVRLTKSETIAVSAALNRIGIPADDPLRASVEKALLSPGVQEDELRRVLAPLSPTDEASTLATCAEALAQGMTVSFDYQGSLDNAMRRRRAEVVSLEQGEGNWYLEGFDLDRMGMRSFRIDRMANAVIEGPAEGRTSDVEADDSRVVDIFFKDVSYLSLFAWPGLELKTSDQTGAEGTIPYYGGMWLPRRIAACAGMVTTNDAEVMGLARAYASELLSR